MQIRRTDGELLKKLPKDSSAGGDKDNGDGDGDSALILPREKCIPVVRGLMALILSMDFTCNVDLFLVACKVSVVFCHDGQLVLTLHRRKLTDIKNIGRYFYV